MNRLPFIQTRGTQFVDDAGKPVTFRGCNLGNWLLIEPWMFGGCIEAPDQAHILATFQQRFGIERASRLLSLYRSNWITPRDFDLVKSYGTMWSFKLIKPAGGAASNSWYCVTNKEDLPKLSPAESSFEELEKFFIGLGTVTSVAHEPTFSLLSRDEPAGLPMTIAPADAAVIEGTAIRLSLGTSNGFEASAQVQPAKRYRFSASINRGPVTVELQCNLDDHAVMLNCETFQIERAGTISLDVTAVTNQMTVKILTTPIDSLLVDDARLQEVACR